MAPLSEYSTDARLEIQIPVYRLLPGLPSQVKPRIHWSEEQRVFVCLFFRLWKGSRALGKTFNHVFRKDLARDGFQNGCPYTSLHTMWDTIRRGGCGENNYSVQQQIDHMSERQLWNKYPSVLEKITHAAHVLNMSLELRDTDMIRKKLVPARRRRLRNETPEASSSESSFVVEDDSDDLSGSSPRTTSEAKRRVFALLDTGPMTNTAPLAWLDLFPAYQDNLFGELSAGRQMSQVIHGKSRYRRLLYRAYEGDESPENPRHTHDTETGLRAGLFRNSSDLVFEPVQLGSLEFETYAVNHLSDDDRNMATPFISFSENPKAAVHRALKFKCGKVVVIDLHVAIAVLQSRFRKTLDVWWPAAYVVKELGLKGKLHGGYNGQGEYLVWGEVSEKAILATLNIDDLQRTPQLSQMLQINILKDCMRAHEIRKRLDKSLLPKVNFETGKTIGSFLFQHGVLHWRHLEVLSTKIAANWRFKGAIRRQRNKRGGTWLMRETADYEDFCNGVLNGAFVLGDGKLRRLDADVCGFTFERNDEDHTERGKCENQEGAVIVVEISDNDDEEGGLKSSRDDDEENDVVPPGRKRKILFQGHLPIRAAKRPARSVGGKEEFIGGPKVGWGAMAGRSDGIW